MVKTKSSGAVIEGLDSKDPRSFHESVKITLPRSAAEPEDPRMLQKNLYASSAFRLRGSSNMIKKAHAETGSTRQLTKDRDLGDGGDGRTCNVRWIGLPRLALKTSSYNFSVSSIPSLILFVTLERVGDTAALKHQRGMFPQIRKVS